MSGTVENIRLAEVTTGELGADELDVVAGGTVSMSFSKIEFSYSPQKAD
jgi:hypothetical protein